MRIFVVYGQKTLFVAAMGAAHEHGFVPEAVCRTECVALAREELFAALFAEIFLFRGVLCRDKCRHRERKNE